jgi:hypothetical protein
MNMCNRCIHDAGADNMLVDDRCNVRNIFLFNSSGLCGSTSKPLKDSERKNPSDRC